MGVDYRRYPLLFVDDEVPNQVAFRYAMEEQFHVLTASGGHEALRILAEHEVAVLLTDQRMPEMGGVELCMHAAARFPNVLRLIVTAYADVHAAIDAINSGQVDRYILKPWRNEDLVEVLQTCIDFVHLRGTMRDVELRLLSSGQNHLAEIARGEFTRELANPLSALALSIDRSSALIASALQDLESLGDGVADAARAKLSAALQSEGEALVVVEQLNAMSGGMRRRDPLAVLAAGVTCDATRVVDATVRILRSEIERVAELVVSLDASPVVAIDPTSLGRVVLNLLLDAAQAVAEIGRPGYRITVLVSSIAAEALIRVQYARPGIAETDSMRSFKSHVTTKPERSRLGLPLVQDSVQQVGGRIEILETVGGGASIEVYLPLAVST